MFVGLAIGCSGCWLKTLNAQSAPASIDVGGRINTPTPLVVVDARPEVLSREIAPTYVGREWALAGIPYPKHTDSGEPLATDLGKQLRWRIPPAYPLFRIYEVPPAKDSASAREAATPRRPDERFGLLFTVYDWQNEVTGQWRLRHDVGLEVVGPEGKILASSRSTSEEQFKHPELMQRISDIFSRLLNAPTVVAALQGSPLPAPTAPSAAPASAPAADDPTPWPGATQPAAPPPAAAGAHAKCSVDQVLRMKEMNFKDAQIKAACE